MPVHFNSMNLIMEINFWSSVYKIPEVSKEKILYNKDICHLENKVKTGDEKLHSVTNPCGRWLLLREY